MTDKPTHADVLLGRGVGTTRHPGNQHFRSIVSQHCKLYATSTKKQKMTISRSIVDKIHSGLDLPGRFLQKNSGDGLWHEVDDKRALEKTAQALRDGAAPLRKQLLDDMSDPAFLDTFFDDDDGSVKSSRSRSRKRTRVPKKGKDQKQRRTNSAASKAKNAPYSPDGANSTPPRAKKRRVTVDVERVTPDLEQAICSTPQTQLAFSKDLTLSQPGDYAPLPLKPVHEETETVVSLDDILLAVEILSDTSIPPAECRQSMMAHHLQMAAMGDDWRNVIDEWKSDDFDQDWGYFP